MNVHARTRTVLLQGVRSESAHFTLGFRLKQAGQAVKYRQVIFQVGGLRTFRPPSSSSSTSRTYGPQKEARALDELLGTFTLRDSDTVCGTPSAGCPILSTRHKRRMPTNRDYHHRPLSPSFSFCFGFGRCEGTCLSSKLSRVWHALTPCDPRTRGFATSPLA